VSPSVDVIVDRRDDIATVWAIRELAAREPGVLAVSIAPRSQAEPAVVWAILRALGKRIEQLDRTKIKVWWMDAERWLVAHRVREMVVLCAQHLGDRATEELTEHVCGRLQIALMLVYCGSARSAPPATTTLDAYLAQQHRAPSAHVRFRPWPRWRDRNSGAGCVSSARPRIPSRLMSAAAGPSSR
jgi:hypothetical protein